MERAPLPPHERTWRHPSEIDPVSTVVDTTGESDHSLSALLATGTLVVIVVAALAVTFTPRRAASPVALTSTTLPAVAQSIRSVVATNTTTELQAGIVALANSVRTTRIDEFTAVPTAIASVPAGIVRHGEILIDVASERIASSNVVLPDLTDEVLVITSDYTYPVPWRDVPHLTILHDAVVVVADGSIVAVITDGRLVVASDSYEIDPTAPTLPTWRERANVGDPISLDD